MKKSINNNHQPNNMIDQTFYKHIMELNEKYKPANSANQINNKLPMNLLNTDLSVPNTNRPQNLNNKIKFSIEAILGTKSLTTESSSLSAETKKQVVGEKVPVVKQFDKYTIFKNKTTFHKNPTDKSYSYFQTIVDRRPTDSMKSDNRNPTNLRMSVDSQSSEDSSKSFSSHGELRSPLEGRNEEAAMFQKNFYNQVASLEARRKSLLETSLKASAGERVLPQFFRKQLLMPTRSDLQNYYWPIFNQSNNSQLQNQLRAWQTIASKYQPQLKHFTSSQIIRRNSDLLPMTSGFSPPPFHLGNRVSGLSSSEVSSTSQDLPRSTNKKRRKWTRTVFSVSQRIELEKSFQMQKYVAKRERLGLAEHLGLTDAQVRIWFQNRRMKWRQEQRIIFRHSGKPSGIMRPEINSNIQIGRHVLM